MELTVDVLVARARALAPAQARAKYAADPKQLAIVDDIILAVVAELCVKIVDECWDRLKPKTLKNPGPLMKLRLWWLIREATCSPRVVKQTQGRGWDGARVYQELGDDAFNAVLALGVSLSDGEIAVIRLKGIS